YDALGLELFAAAMLRAMAHGTGGRGQRGALTGTALAALHEVSDLVALQPRLASAEQTNSSILYGERFMLKLFRVIEEGPSLEYEVGSFLARRDPPYSGVPRLVGALEYTVAGREPSTLGTMFDYVP